MSVRILSSASDLKTYDAWVRSHEHGSLWQSLERKTYNEACGKQTRIYVSEANGEIVASALVVIDRTAGGYSTWEIPRGPLLASSDERVADSLLHLIVEDARLDTCLAIYLSPKNFLPAIRYPLSASLRRIHAEATRIVDLTQSDEQILIQMHQKGRYNIGVAAKAGITVRKGSIEDLDAFYDLLKSTGGRDGFTISQKSHYTRFLSSLEGSFLLLAEHQGRAIAGLIGVVWPSPSPRPADAGHPSPVGRGAGGEGAVGIYYYGASSYEDRQLMAPYALQWEAMRLCKAAGCTRYDLLGISPEDAPQSDPWRGITDFKRKFGGTVITYPPEQMMVLKPMTSENASPLIMVRDATSFVVFETASAALRPPQTDKRLRLLTMTIPRML
jgi:lipid II:glycine glycyltransferase (peptidoglycan interpeptide bridge formation enzyme)